MTLSAPRTFRDSDRALSSAQSDAMLPADVCAGMYLVYTTTGLLMGYSPAILFADEIAQAELARAIAAGDVEPDTMLCDEYTRIYAD